MAQQSQYAIEDAPASSTAPQVAKPGNQYAVEDAPDDRPFWQRWKDNFNANTQGAQPGDSAVKGFVENIGQGGGQVVRALAHPINTATSMMQSFSHPLDTAHQEVNSLYQDPSRFIGNAIGQAGTGAIIGDAVATPVGAIARKAGSALTGGTAPAAELSEATTTANDTAAATAAEKNAAIMSKRTAELNDHLQAIQTAKGEEPTSLETGRPRNAKELQSHKEALQRGVEQLDPQFQEDLKTTAKAAKASVDNKYDTVNQALSSKVNPEDGSEVTPAPTVASPDLAKAVTDAEAHLMGSTENIKQFRDILSKHPESDPDFVTYQGAKIPQGHPLYDIIKQGDTSPGATFRDLQGYYSELGDKIAGGGLSGDVYQAMKSLHSSIGQMMQGLADDAGVGDALRDAQSSYRDYAQAFREPSSPIYKAIKSTERGDAIKQFQGKDQSGVGVLAKFNPDLAKRANTIRAYQQEANSIPNRPFVEKSAPTLAPSEPLVTPEFKTIGPTDITAAKAGELAVRTAKMQRAVNNLAKYSVGLRMLGRIGQAMHGNVGALADIPADVGEAAVFAGAGNGLARLLQSENVSRLLTKPTAADVATINPEIARDLGPIMDEAKRQGIKISPAVSAAISANATKDKWWDAPQ